MEQKDADRFDILEDKLTGAYEEIGILSKKNPDGPINKFKLGLLNGLLREANELLGEECVPCEDFETFDEDDLPSASDVVFIISQYLRTMDKYRFDNTKIHSGAFHWVLDKKGTLGSRTRKAQFILRN